jgi:hypothetical protein
MIGEKSAQSFVRDLRITLNGQLFDFKMYRTYNNFIYRSRSLNGDCGAVGEEAESNFTSLYLQCIQLFYHNRLGNF